MGRSPGLAHCLLFRLARAGVVRPPTLGLFQNVDDVPIGDQLFQKSSLANQGPKFDGGKNGTVSHTKMGHQLQVKSGLGQLLVNGGLRKL